MASRLEIAMRMDGGLGQSGGDLLELAGVVEIVEAHEEERLAPVEWPEEGMLHRAVEMALGVGGEHAREEHRAILLDDLQPLLGGARRRVLVAATREPRGQRRPGGEGHDGATEVAAGRHHVGHHLVAAPVVGARLLREALGGHQRGGGAQLAHRALHLLHDLGGRELGPLRLEIAPDALLLLVHGAAATSTRQELYVEAPEGAARSSVSRFAQPRVSTPVPSSANHAPSLMDTTPGAMRAVTFAGRRVAPRSLKTRTRCPSVMPRAAASAGWIQMSWRSARARIGWLSWIECVRARDLGDTQCRGWPVAGAGGAIQVGIGGMGPSPHGFGSAASALEEISVIPEGGANGCRWG